MIFVSPGTKLVTGQHSVRIGHLGHFSRIILRADISEADVTGPGVDPVSPV